MALDISIKTALISVFHKDGLLPLVQELSKLGVTIYSTGGTQTFIEDHHISVTAVEDLTSYPSILGGRVKTLHPKIFGGILNRKDNKQDQKQLEEYKIPQIDLVIVDLYPFEKTVASGPSEQDIIEKIDIGGISLIRATAKNYKDTLCISSMEQYPQLLSLLQKNNGTSTLTDRKLFATQSFGVTSHYDTSIFNYFNQDSKEESLKISNHQYHPLRYGENPHQKGAFFGDLKEIFEQLNGKELSYNNLLDINAATNLMKEFDNNQCTFAILKHNNACGIATRATVKEAYQKALQTDPLSAFGGVLISNTPIDLFAAQTMADLFFEIIIAPSYSKEALEVLEKKKNRIILQQKQPITRVQNVRSCLNGVLKQDDDSITDSVEQFKIVTKAPASKEQQEDMVFGSKICKNTKSNAIILVKDKLLLASGTGQTSRVDALQQAIKKAKTFDFNLKGAVMISDAFFPFPDCVEIASTEGISAILQPGGSIKDQLSIDACDQKNIAMVFTGTRHFKH